MILDICRYAHSDCIPIYILFNLNFLLILFVGADNTILHLFPNPDKDLDRFNIWKNAIGGDILNLDQSTVFVYRRVCHVHFEPQYHTRSKRLSPNAVPTLLLTGILLFI